MSAAILGAPTERGPVGVDELWKAAALAVQQKDPVALDKLLRMIHVAAPRVCAVCGERPALLNCPECGRCWGRGPKARAVIASAMASAGDAMRRAEENDLRASVVADVDGEVIP